eukprot:6891844-Prymnesium_polylepis.1
MFNVGQNNISPLGSGQSAGANAARPDHWREPCYQEEAHACPAAATPRGARRRVGAASAAAKAAWARAGGTSPHFL